MAKSPFAQVTLGDMLKEEFLAEYGLSQNQLAKAIGISPFHPTALPRSSTIGDAFPLIRRSDWVCTWQ